MSDLPPASETLLKLAESFLSQIVLKTLVFWVWYALSVPKGRKVSRLVLTDFLSTLYCVIENVHFNTIKGEVMTNDKRNALQKQDFSPEPFGKPFRGEYGNRPAILSRFKCRQVDPKTGQTCGKTFIRPVTLSKVRSCGCLKKRNAAKSAETRQQTAMDRALEVVDQMLK